MYFQCQDLSLAMNYLQKALNLIQTNEQKQILTQLYIFLFAMYLWIVQFQHGCNKHISLRTKSLSKFIINLKIHTKNASIIRTIYIHLGVLIIFVVIILLH